MSNLAIFTGLATGVALIAGYCLGVLSGRWQDVVSAALSALNLASIFWLVGLPLISAAPVVIAFFVATTFGVIVTGRIRPLAHIDDDLHFVLGATTVANVAVVVCALVSRHAG